MLYIWMHVTGEFSVLHSITDVMWHFVAAGTNYP